MDTVLGLSLPYMERAGTNVSLKKIILADQQDLTRYTIELNEHKRCSSIIKSYSKSGEEIKEPVEFIENQILEEKKRSNVPLLIKLPSSHKKIKFNVLIKPVENYESKSLIILKAKETLENVQLRSILHQECYAQGDIEVSKLSYSTLPVNRTNKDFQKIIVNDSFNSTMFKNKRINISLWEYDNIIQDYNFLFSFSLWISEVANDPEESGLSQPSEDDRSSKMEPKTNRRHVKPLKISDYRNAFKLDIEDGPEFRKEVSSYQAHLPIFKKTCMNLLDELRSLQLYLKRMRNTRVKIIEHSQTLARLHFNSLLNKMGFMNDFDDQLKLIFDPFEKNIDFFSNNVCNEKLLSKISSNLSNTVSNDGSGPNELLHSRKHFENGSKEYYSWLNKYLSNEKERPELKLLAKRKAFELSKLDYLNHLNLVVNNQYFNQLLENVLKFNGLPYNEKDRRVLDFKIFSDPKLSQDLLDDNYKIYLNVLSRFNSQKFQFRQMIEASQSNEELTNVIRYNVLNQTAPLLECDTASNEDPILRKDNIDLIFSNLPTYFTDSAPVSPANDATSDMSGILYTLGGQGKQGWHKEWVVLNNGQLIEYSDWRKAKVQINRPIELALSSIKPMNYEKRQHCFEILTSTGHKHVFQAINEDERNQWVKALYKAGQIVDTSRLRETYTNATRAKQLNTDARTQLSSLVTDLSENRVIAPITQDQSHSPVSIFSRPLLSEKDYLKLVRSIIDSGNDCCVDCGSSESVEWVSLSFLVCFCVKCSSFHRNLGSHISRIKSLKLDNFDNESEMLLNYINNNQVNSYLEGNLIDAKPTSSSSDDERLTFITKKYINKKYLQQVDNPDDFLIKSIQKIDMPNILRGIISGGNTNINVQISIHSSNVSKIISLFEYSLRKFIQIEDGDPDNSKTKKLFIISELLVLNGCDIKDITQLDEDIGITSDAVAYYETRRSKITGM
ncbi:uncharacterized protein PRCAT00006156001 [Priceomyces carsonii]|uniref:uncharacterized protein n=1 Tax=Priceomyces carsonii TaxID=28549 RepID=UPI002EDA5086|nr:unnamed protein product [Priceomyces carsonii]